MQPENNQPAHNITSTFFHGGVATAELLCSKHLLFVTLRLAFVFRLFLKLRNNLKLVNVLLYKMSRLRKALHDIKFYCLQSSLKAT